MEFHEKIKKNEELDNFIWISDATGKPVDVISEARYEHLQRSAKKNFKFISTLNECIESSAKKMKTLKIISWILILTFAAISLVLMPLCFVFINNETAFWPILYCLIGSRLACILSLVFMYIIQKNQLENTVDQIEYVKDSQ